MTIDQLKYFVTTAQYLNYSEAARRHYISQPALAHQIRELEQELGAELFVRSGNRILLTSEGSLFLPEAIRILSKLDNAIISVRKSYFGKVGCIRISMLCLLNSVLIDMLSAFSSRYPDIEIDVAQNTHIDQLNDMNSDDHDFFFTTSPMLLDYPDLDSTVTNYDQYCVAFPKGHPLAQQPLNFELYKDLPFVTFSPVEAALPYEQIMKICERRNYTPKIIGRYNRVEGTPLSVISNSAISILPRGLINSYAADVIDYIPINEPDATFSCAIAWHKDMNNSAAIKFRNLVLEKYPKEALTPVYPKYE